MRQAFDVIKIATHGAGLYDFTEDTGRFVEKSRIHQGLLTCFIRHTSASLVIQEKADPEVLADLEDFMRRLVIRDSSLYRHTAEGPDDVPSHIRAMLTSPSLSIPVRDGRLCLGRWQGLYVFEHRDAPHTREVTLHLVGD